MREGMFKLMELETSAKGRLRIPDVIVLKITDQELIKMWMDGKATWEKLIPVRGNIAKVVEIKFGNDRLSDVQQRDYSRIAGGVKKFRLLEDIDCNCNIRDDHSNHSGGATIGAKYTYIQNSFVAVTLKQGQRGNVPANNSPIPIGDFLDNAPVYEIAVGVGVAVILVGAIVLLPVSAGAAGVGALGGYVLATS